MLKVDEVSLKYGRRLVVDKASLHLEPGTSAAIIGRSGSGKSSLLSAILGLVKPSTGVITVNGDDVSKMSKQQKQEYLRHTVSMVFQHGELIDELEPIENVAVAALLSGSSRTEAFDAAKKLLEDLSLPTTGILTRDISGGERQRVAIARALITKPQLVLADEPTGSLDTEFRDMVGDLILSIPERWGSAVLMVTHDLDLGHRADAVYQLVPSEDGPAHLNAL
ncbi:ABC transporter ATP-binding protein [Devriesea agamarum]|uniref:ABC transporter ATP-binding protein n=1 Tax=Devriesea agamarum TaxID=472569 RepID=UPI00071D3187|nr:ATP-binding cassette domain-containing protein [Devriesea agamarum]